CDVVGLLGEPDDPLRGQSADGQRPAETQPPGLRKAPIDHDLSRPAGEIAAADDRVPARSPPDHLGDAVAGVLPVAVELDTGHLLTQRVRPDVGQLADPLPNPIPGLRVERTITSARCAARAARPKPPPRSSATTTAAASIAAASAIPR